jgi:hypothetical protein
MTLHAVILNRDFAPINTPDDLTLTVGRLSANDKIGYKTARIDVRGDPDALASLSAWLRFGVRIINDAGVTVWIGYVNEIEVSISGVTATLSLDGMSNRIKTIYTYSDPNGTVQRGDTEWAQSDVSISNYGIKEMVLSRSEMTEAVAVNLRDRMLERIATPTGNPSIGGGETKATLFCKGLLTTAEWRYYAQESGRIEYESDNAEQVVGWAIYDSDDIGFADNIDGRNLLCDIGARLHADGIKVGDRFRISNAVANNGLWQVQETTSFEGTQIVDSASIRIEMSDDLKYTDMSAFERYNPIRIAGSLYNDGHYIMDDGPSDGNTHIATAFKWDSLTQDENVSGYTVTITQGNAVSLTAAPTSVTPGTSGINCELVGLRIAQRITLTQPWAKFGRVALKVRKIGNPSDWLTVIVRIDDGGAPGSEIASSYLTAAEIGTTATWKMFDFTYDEGGLPGDFWIVIERDGDPDPENYYAVAIDTAAGSSNMRLWDGTAYQSTTWNLAYRLWGEDDTGTQMIDILNYACAPYITGVMVYGTATDNKTGILSIIYRPGDTTAAVEVAKLLDMGASTYGTTDVYRLAVQVTEERGVLITPASTTPPTTPRISWTAQGVKGISGDPIDEGSLFPGEWVRIAWPGNLDDTLSNMSWMYAEEVEYDARTQTYTVSPTSAKGWGQGLSEG